MLSLKSQVEKVLELAPQTRNSDIWLTIAIWKYYHQDKIHLNTYNNKHYVYLEDLLELPREDNVKRIRANIQNTQHRFLPTDIAVLKQRKINEIWWHSEYSPSNPSRG